MKNSILLYLLCSSVFLINSTSYAQQKNGWTEEYIKENVAITKMRARVTTPGLYVCEITITDFSKKLPAPEGFGLIGYAFSDNGTGNDLVKGDGVYSSTEQIKFLNGQPNVLEKNTIYYDQGFKYKSNLDTRDPSTAKIGCSLRKCGCPCSAGYTCRACEWWGWQCWEVYQCEVSLF